MSGPPWPLNQPEEPGRAELLRVVFLGTLGVELFTQIAHAGRYGAGHFNVSHIPALDGVLTAPDAPVVVLTLLSLSFISLKAAFGGGLRVALPLLWAGYSGLYFVSQLDSYQHHYLLSLLLGVLAAGLWLEPGQPTRFPAWSLALVRAQVAVVYAWATVAKLHPEWLNGRVLLAQIRTTDRGGPWLEAVSEALNATPLALAQAAAVGVCAVEALLVLGWLWRRLWPVALPLGLGLHLGIELLGFEIGLFSWFMFGLYTLLLPARWVAALARGLPGSDPGPWSVGWMVGAALLCGAAALGVPLEDGWTLACLWFGLSVLCSGGGGWRSALASAGAAGVLLLLANQTATLRDHYRYLGGDTRRRGALDEAITAYARVVELDPEYYSGWVRLADLRITAGERQEAILLLERARLLEPRNPEALRRLMALYLAQGDPARAVALARTVLEVEPDDAEARRTLARYADVPARAPAGATP